MADQGDEKRAFWGAAAKGLATGAGSFGKGLLGFGATRGAGMGGKAMNVAGKATGVVAPLAASVAGGAGSGASVLGFPLGKTGSVALDRAAAKAAGFDASDAVDLASYGSFIGAKLTDPHKYPRLHAALDAAGLVGLAGTTAHGMLRDRAEFKPGAKDLVGLALMGSALVDRARSHGH